MPHIIHMVLLLIVYGLHINMLPLSLESIRIYASFNTTIHYQYYIIGLVL